VREVTNFVFSIIANPWTFLGLSVLLFYIAKITDKDGASEVVTATLLLGSLITLGFAGVFWHLVR